MMKHFIKHSVVFAIGVFLLVFIGLILPNNNPVRTVDYSLVAKHNLLKQIKQPKIVLTGGSNVIFGFNSRILQDNLNYPVVNHAIHAGYGLKYIVEDLLQYVNKGDVIILSPEYSHFIGNNFYGKEPLLFSLTVKPSNLKLISLKQFASISEFIPQFSFDRIKSFIYNKVKNSKQNINSGKNYTEFSINKFGDHYTHWDDKGVDLKFYNFNGEVNVEVIEFLNAINDQIENKGARLIISYPSLCKSTYEKNKKTIIEIENKLKKYGNFKILDTPQDHVYADEVFYDTSYHLTGDGVIVRSKKLVGELKKELQ